MSTPDNLDRLSDLELNAVFAAEIAGWFIDLPPQYAQGFRPKSTKPEPIPGFSTDANALLPWLDKYQWQLTRWNPMSPQEAEYWINLPMGSPGSVEATAPTFARSAATALIRAARATKGKAP